jgi:hypothetical protein
MKALKATQESGSLVKLSIDKELLQKITYLIHLCCGLSPSRPIVGSDCKAKIGYGSGAF